MLNRLSTPVKLNILALLISLILVLVTLYFPVAVSSQEDLRSVELGLPFRFVVQDQSHYDPPFPATVRFYSILENPTKVDFPKLILSILVVVIVVDMVLIFLNRVIRKSKLTADKKINQ